MDSLPKETLVNILQFLPYPDLKRARLVSRRFLDASFERKLWTDFSLFVSESNITKLQDIFCLSIMKDLSKVTFTGCLMKNEHVKIMVSKEIKHLQLGSRHDPDYDVDISRVSAKNLAKLISKLHVFKFHNSMMSEMKQNQTCAILRQLIKESQVNKLEIFFNNHLTSIIPETLSRALSSVTELTLGLQSNHKS